MRAAVEAARMQQDSVGGVIECAAVGVPAGVGSPFFDSVESVAAHLLFSVPAVKAVEFGDGLAIAGMRASQANDPMTFMELFVTGNGYAKFMGGFSDAEYDELMKKASSSQDQAERLELFKKAEKILMDKGGTIPMFYNTNHMYYQSYVSGLSMPMFGGEYDFSRVEILPH